MKSKSDPMETEVDEEMEEVNLEQDISMLSNSLDEKVKINELEYKEEEELNQLQTGTRYFVNNEASYKQIKPQEILQIKCIEVETLIPVDYIYKNVTIPLIFVNTYVSGISLKEQYTLVKEDINEVIRHFVDGNITPNDTTITNFFKSNPGTMIYSPQLVRTIVSLEQEQLMNRKFNQLSNRTRQEKTRQDH